MKFADKMGVQFTVRDWERQSGAIATYRKVRSVDRTDNEVVLVQG